MVDRGFRRLTSVLYGFKFYRYFFRLNDSRIEIEKLTKLVEDLTTNCENLQRQRRESDSLLRNLRGELGIACKTRKAAEAQMETYRCSIKNLEEQISSVQWLDENGNESYRQHCNFAMASGPKPSKLVGAMPLTQVGANVLKTSLGPMLLEHSRANVVKISR